MIDQDEYFPISQLLNRFFNSFDQKNWDGLRACLGESLYTDYTDLRGTPAETISADRFVDLRRVSLSRLNTQHLASNYEISINRDQGKAQASTLIFRKSESEEEFNTHCLYQFGVRKTNGLWLIESIVQKVLWNEGNAQIHQGAEKKS